MSKNKKLTIKSYKNAVITRGHNRRTSIYTKTNRDKVEKEEDIIDSNEMQFVALTSEVTDGPGVDYGLHCKGKIKVSHVRLSDDAILELYISLHHYLKDVLKVEV
jgi:hypothetical protein